MCVCVCIVWCMQVSAFGCEGPLLMLDNLTTVSLLCFKQGLSLNLEPSGLARLTGQWDPKILSSPPPSVRVTLPQWDVYLTVESKLEYSCWLGKLYTHWAISLAQASWSNPYLGSFFLVSQRQHLSTTRGLTSAARTPREPSVFTWALFMGKKHFYRDG